MKTYTLPGGESVSLDDITRVYPPVFDWKMFWKNPLQYLLKGGEYHFFELDIRPDRHVRIYDDKEMMRFRILLQFIHEEEREEILF